MKFVWAEYSLDYLRRLFWCFTVFLLLLYCKNGFDEIVLSVDSEKEGFEPSVVLQLRRFSKPMHSTTLPPFHFRFSLRKRESCQNRTNTLFASHVKTAGDAIRTRDMHLGKVPLYHWATPAEVFYIEPWKVFCIDALTFKGFWVHSDSTTHVYLAQLMT